MKISFDTIANTLLPWDLSLTIKGVDYKIRPVTVGEVGMLQVQSATDVPKLVELIGGLFEGQRPDLMAMELHMLMGIAVATLKYFTEYSKKNSEVVAKTVADAVADQAKATTTAA